MNKTKNSGSLEGKVQLFKDFTDLLNYTKDLVKNEPQTIQDKTFTYLACRAPKLWNKNAVALTVVLARLEAQLSNLTQQHNHWITSNELLNEQAVKQIKSIAQACSGITTQIHTLTTRLGVSEAQLHGSAMRHELTNDNSREIADLVLSSTTEGNSENTPNNSSLAEAKERSKKLLERLQKE